MPKDNLPPGHKRFEFRAGFGDLQWKGMLTNGDAGANPPNRPRMLVNARLTGGGYVERAGLTTFDTLVSSSACVRLIADFQLSSPKKLWIRGDGCPGVSSSAGFYIATLDQEQSPEFQRAVYYSAATTSVILARFDGALHLGVDGALKKLQLIIMPYGTENLSASGSSQDTPIYSFPAGTISCMQEFDGKLFIGVDNGPGASSISTWDGISIRSELTGINAPTSFGLYRVQNGGDCIVVGFGTATNHIRYRPTGASPGTWTTVVPAAGTVASVAMAAYKDVLYITDGALNLWSYDGTTLTIARVPASGTAVRAVATFNGLLYFGYDTSAAAIIGKYDGSTWTDVEKNLTTQFTGTSSIRYLAAYRGCLIGVGVETTARGRIWISPGTTTTGTYVKVIPNVGNNGDASFLLVA